MDAVLENVESTVELLAIARTDCVSEWDGETVDRALQWAQYCEHVHSRFHTNPSVREALDRRLRDTNHLLECTFTGHRSVTLCDLARCRHRLLDGLLNNPATPHPVIKSISDRFGLTEDAAGDLSADLDSLSACRSGCTLLADFRTDCCLSVGTQVHGTMLLERIQVIQSRPGNQAYSTALLDCLLEDGAEEHESFFSLLAAALLSTSTTREDTPAQEFLLTWLEGHGHLLHRMCQALSPELCTRVARKWTRFKVAYWDSLKKSASSLEFDLSSGLWIQSCDPTVSFLGLSERFESLWSAGSLLKNETEEWLVALKQADGDFEVKGLSVWTDLLGQLK